MKKLQLKARVLDRETNEEVSVTILREVSEDFANAFIKELKYANEQYWKDFRFGHGDDDSDIPEMASPFRDQERFHINLNLHLIQENTPTGTNYMCGISR